MPVKARKSGLALLLRALPFCFALLFISSTAHAQQLIIPTTDALPDDSAQSGQQNEPDFIVPSRPTLSNPAEFQRPGVLQIEYGYDGSFHNLDSSTQQSAPIALRFAASRRLLLELDLGTVISQKDATGARATGIGDTAIGVQGVAVKETEEHPALAFAYYFKLPTASEAKGLGSGRVDHKIIVLVSKTIKQTDIDFNAAYLIVGREGERGWVTGGQFALAFSQNFKRNYSLQGELSGQTKDDAQPPGLFAIGALAYKVNRRLVLDSGMRFGLTDDAPRVGVFAGLTVGMADLYRKRQ